MTNIFVPIVMGILSGIISSYAGFYAFFGVIRMPNIGPEVSFIIVILMPLGISVGILYSILRRSIHTKSKILSFVILIVFWLGTLLVDLWNTLERLSVAW